jgi:hypothetical protein
VSKGLTRRDCSICSVYLSKPLVPAYTEHYVLNLHYIKVWNIVRNFLHWSDCFFFLYVIHVFCRNRVIASHTVLFNMHHNNKFLYPMMLRHCSNGAVKLCVGCTHCVRNVRYMWLLLALFLMMLNNGCFIITVFQLYIGMFLSGMPNKCKRD